MTYYTEEELIAEVPGLDHALLVRFMQADVVVPVMREAQKDPLYRPVDIARLRLACDLVECFDLQEDALSVMLKLIDQLYATRSELRAVMEAIEAQEPDVRRGIGTVLAEEFSA